MLRETQRLRRVMPVSVRMGTCPGHRFTEFRRISKVKAGVLTAGATPYCS